MWKLKSKVEIYKLTSTTLVFLLRYREARKLPLVLVGAPRKKSLVRAKLPVGNSMDSLDPSPRANGSSMCLPASLSWNAPRHFHYQTFGRTAAGLVPFGTWWQPHHKCSWCDLTRLQGPPMYNNGARKHRVIRGVQTSLNTRPKPRASA